MMGRLRRVIAIRLLGGDLPQALYQLSEGLPAGQLLKMLGESGVVPNDLFSLIEKLGDFRETLVREVMVPRPDMICVSEESSPEEIIHLSRSHGFSRFPVYKGQVDTIIGVLHAKDLLSFGLGEKTEIKNIIREPYYVPETKKILDLLRDMQARKIHLAIVLDEYGGVSGLITMEDLLEQAFGEIEDEFDQGEKEGVVPLSAGGWEMEGDLEVREVEDLLGVKIDQRGFDTVGGLIYDRMGRIPNPGDRVIFQGFQFQVLEMDGHRVAKVKVQRIPEELSKNERK